MDSNTKSSIIITIIVLAEIVVFGCFIYAFVPTGYQDIYIEYKFIRGNDCYIIGKSIVDSKEQIDLYKINAQDYNKIEEGSEYKISTVYHNHWKKMSKTIHIFKDKGDESND